MVGVHLENAPADWQILQRSAGGTADIELSGTFEPYEGNERSDTVIMARILREDDGSVVRDWTETAPCGNRFSLCLRAVPAGGLYRLETGYRSREDVFDFCAVVHGDMRHHVGVGDVYVIAGQSNAAGFGRDAVYDPPQPGIHLLKNSLCWDMASHPMNDSTSTVHPVNLEGPNTGHSPWLSFARTLYRALNVPIGLVQASMGGSALEEWNPGERGQLYSSMMDTLHTLPGGVCGMVWIQGCSDAEEARAPGYFARFGQFVTSLRSDLNRPDFPVLTVQLNRLEPTRNDSADAEEEPWWGVIREAQRQAARRDRRVLVVPSCDLPLCDEIHNTAASNMVIGERLARLALFRLYGIGPDCEAPDLESAVQTGDDRIELTFSRKSRLVNQEKIPLPVTVSDALGENIVVRYTIHANKIDLQLRRKISEMTKVSMGWRRNIGGAMPKNGADYLPALCFFDVTVSV